MVYSMRSEKCRWMKLNEENDPPQNTTEAKQSILSKKHAPKQCETAGGVKKGFLKSSEHLISHSPAKTRSLHPHPTKPVPDGLLLCHVVSDERVSCCAASFQINCYNDTKVCRR
jgi:hypothetical protein